MKELPNKKNYDSFSKNEQLMIYTYLYRKAKKEGKEEESNIYREYAIQILLEEEQTKKKEKFA